MNLRSIYCTIYEYSPVKCFDLRVFDDRVTGFISMSDSELAGSFDWSDFEVDAEFLDCFFPGFRPTAVFFFVGGVAECALDSESESL